jgi:hypothetical protein
MMLAQLKPQISPELLDQIDIRVGIIESVSDVANSEKLVALRVNFGDHLRKVLLAGMKREQANPMKPSRLARLARVDEIHFAYAKGIDEQFRFIKVKPIMLQGVFVCVHID